MIPDFFPVFSMTVSASFLVQIAVRINLKESDCVLVKMLVDGAPVAGNIDAPLAASVPRKRVIVKEGMEREPDKHLKPIVEVLPHQEGGLLVLLSEMRMKLEGYHE